MNMLVAPTLHSLLHRDRSATPRAVRGAADRRMPSEGGDTDWAADTRPVIFRSEAFAEDLDDHGAR